MNQTLQTNSIVCSELIHLCLKQVMSYQVQRTCFRLFLPLNVTDILGNARPDLRHPFTILFSSFIPFSFSTFFNLLQPLHICSTLPMSLWASGPGSGTEQTRRAHRDLNRTLEMKLWHLMITMEVHGSSWDAQTFIPDISRMIVGEPVGKNQERRRQRCYPKVSLRFSCSPGIQTLANSRTCIPRT